MCVELGDNEPRILVIPWSTRRGGRQRAMGIEGLRVELAVTSQTWGMLGRRLAGRATSWGVWGWGATSTSRARANSPIVRRRRGHRWRARRACKVRGVLLMEAWAAQAGSGRWATTGTSVSYSWSKARPYESAIKSGRSSGRRLAGSSRGQDGRVARPPAGIGILEEKATGRLPWGQLSFYDSMMGVWAEDNLCVVSRRRNRRLQRRGQSPARPQSVLALWRAPSIP